MRLRSNEQHAVQLYLIYTLLCLPATILVVWLCSGLPRAAALAIVWACCCLQMAGASLLVWLRTLRGLRWPCRHLSIDAPLLVSKGYVVHHAQFPLVPVTQPRMTSGPSILLLSTCAMLTLPEHHLSPAQQAVMDYLAPLKLEQGGFLRKHQRLNITIEGPLNWVVCQDGQGLRAYASGDACAVLSACECLWDGDRKPLTQQTIDELHALWADEELPPMGFAMADMEGGQPVNIVFLGAMLMERSLLPHARHEVHTLHRSGYDVSIQGLEPVSLMRLSTLLHCDPDPLHDDVLTIACTDEAHGHNVYQTRSGTRPTHVVSYLRTQFHRLRYQPIQASLLLTIAALCCLAGQMATTVLAMFHVLLLAQFAFAPLAPRPLHTARKGRVIPGAVSVLVLVPAMCALTAWFMRITIGDYAGACMLFLLPIGVLTGFMCARLSSTMRPMLTLIPVLFFTAGLIAIAVNVGVTLISGLFALVAGTLCAVAANALLQYADKR